MKEHVFQESALLEILHKAQEIYGYLSKDLLTDIAQSLHLPPSKVFGVATFYSLFKLTEPGEHIVTGCLGTACYVKGVEEIMQAIEREAAKTNRTKATPMSPQLVTCTETTFWYPTFVLRCRTCVRRAGLNRLFCCTEAATTETIDRLICLQRS